MIYWRTVVEMTSSLKLFLNSLLYKTKRFQVAVRLFSNRSQRTSKCCKRVFSIPLPSMKYYVVNFEIAFSLLLIPMCSLSVVFFSDVFRFLERSIFFFYQNCSISYFDAVLNGPLLFLHLSCTHKRPNL